MVFNEAKATLSFALFGELAPQQVKSELSLVLCCFAGLASEPTHFHHQGHTQLAQDPLTGHTLVISTVPVTHTPLVGRLCRVRVPMHGTAC